MASETYSSWVDLFDQKEALSSGLLHALKEETSALISNDMHKLDAANQKKSAALRALSDLKKKFDHQRLDSIKKLNLETDTGIRLIISQCEKQESRTLHKRREQLERLSRQIQKTNELNEGFLNSYLEQVRLSQTIYNTVLDPDPTYNAYGQRNFDRHGGRLISRSL